MKILNVKITTESESEIIAKIENAIVNKQKLVIFTPNPEILVHAAHDPAFCELLNTADVNLADGVGLKIAYFLKNGFTHIPLKVNKIFTDLFSLITLKSDKNDSCGLEGNPRLTIIHGIDFMLDLCKEAEIRSWSVGLLGGRNGAAEKTKNKLLSQFPKLKIEYVQSGIEYNFVGDDLRVVPQNGQTWRSVPTKNLDLLFVALGSPKEQLWIAQNRDVFPATVFMQVGGAFDMLSARLRRAPRLMQNLGLEWLWRLWLQPKRIVRQLRLVEFLVRYLLD